MASNEIYSEECNDVEYPIEIKEEKIEIVEHPDEECTYPLKSESDNLYASREIKNLQQNASDVLSCGASNLFRLLPSDTKIRAENASLDYKEFKIITHVEKEELVGKNDIHPQIRYQLVSTKTEVGCRDSGKNVSFQSEEEERNNESANKMERISQLPPLARNIVVEFNGKRENSKCSKSYEITCSKEKQTMETKSSEGWKLTNDPENVFSTSTVPIEIDSQATIYECMLCEGKFSSHSDVKKHAVTHLGEACYKCDICAYKSTDKDNLTRHRRIHIQDRPFQCNLCRYKCTKDSYLKIHMRIHTGEKPFKCETCGYGCTRKSYLEKHMTTHIAGQFKSFQCGVCGWKSEWKSSLNKHMRTHKPKKSLQCGVCGFICTCEWSLNVHMKIHTP